MKRIYKYPVDPPAMSLTEVSMPRGARILSAGAQDEVLVVWAIVDHIQANEETRQLRVYPTGAALDEDGLEGYDFVGTVQMRLNPEHYTMPTGRELVWHVWAKPSDWGSA